MRSPVVGRSTFTDTTDSSVERAAYLGIVTGVGNDRFDPNSPITREQAAVMLSRLAGALGRNLAASNSTFADNAQASSWAVNAVGEVSAVGLMGGTGNNMFSPRADYTKEQSIVTIVRLHDLADAVEVNVNEPGGTESSSSVTAPSSEVTDAIHAIEQRPSPMDTARIPDHVSVIFPTLPNHPFVQVERVGNWRLFDPHGTWINPVWSEDGILMSWDILPEATRSSTVSASAQAVVVTERSSTVGASVQAVVVPERLRELIDDASITFVRIEHDGVLLFFDSRISIRMELVERALDLESNLARVHWTTEDGSNVFSWRNFPKDHEVIIALEGRAITWHVDENWPMNAINDSSQLPIVNRLPSANVARQWIDAWPGVTEFERYVIQFVNEYRVEHGLRSLEICPVLSALAWYRTSYLSQNGFLFANVQPGEVHTWGSHRSTDVSRLASSLTNGERSGGRGINFQSRIVLFSAHQQARAVVDWWIGSPVHRANMLNAQITLVGIGTDLSIDGNHTHTYTFFGVLDNN